MVPLMFRALEHGAQVVITHFSKSAEQHVNRIRKELTHEGRQVEYAGYGPWEGQWREWIAKIRPTVFLTAKYESWPELWMSLAELRVPLIVIAARARRNFYVAERVIRNLRGDLPEMNFIVSDQRDISPFQQLFPKAQVELGGDPRWERVEQRSSIMQPRARMLVDHFKVAPASCGVLGQIWMKDLEFFGDALKTVKGPIWLTPHDVTHENIALIEAFLERHGISYVKSSSLPSVESNHGEVQVVFVSEVGFLAELYKIAAWVYVGGGFSKGVHSTIEPAIHAVPIGCAPKNVEKFTEITQLQESGQLTVLHSREELLAWIEIVQTPVPTEVRAQWVVETRTRIGAADHIFEIITALLHAAQ